MEIRHNTVGISFGKVLRLFATPVSRLLMILLFLLASAYLAYDNGYMPLFGDVELPFSVNERNARLNTASLDSILNAAATRTTYIPKNFTISEPLFTNVKE